MVNDRIEARWIDAFETTFRASGATAGETAIMASVMGSVNRSSQM